MKALEFARWLTDPDRELTEESEIYLKVVTYAYDEPKDTGFMSLEEVKKSDITVNGGSVFFTVDRSY